MSKFVVDITELEATTPEDVQRVLWVELPNDIYRIKVIPLAKV